MLTLLMQWERRKINQIEFNVRIAQCHLGGLPSFKNE